LSPFTDPDGHRRGDRHDIDMSFMRASPMLSFFAILAIFYGWIYAIERNRTAPSAWASCRFTLFMGYCSDRLLQQVLGFKNGVQRS